jgi:hypothetical protein
MLNDQSKGKQQTAMTNEKKRTAAAFALVVCLLPFD